MRPSEPKYDITWDPKIVLDYLSSLPINKKLNTRDLGYKLITLLALITGHRLQTFSLIEVENVEEVNKAIHIKIPKRIKTSGHNKKQPFLNLPFYHKNEKICAAPTLKSYTKRTQSRREGIKFLFLTNKKPFKAATAATLGHWIKHVSAKSGLNTDIFTAHSTRHASTSAAKRKGVNIDLLRKMPVGRKCQILLLSFMTGK